MAQDFEPGSYDLVIAANVLHATASLSNTLENVRTLLKPGGKLMILELTESLLCSLMVFGTLPGKLEFPETGNRRLNQHQDSG